MNSTAHILLIDDDESLLDVLAMTLEDEGYAVSQSRDGDEGLAVYESADVDLIVSDINMPGVDGFQLCRKLRDAGDPVPIVLLTSRDNEVDEALGLDLGADDYVAKPFSSRILLARIKSLLRRQSFRQAGDETSEVTEVGPLTLHTERLEAEFQGEPVETTLTEFRLLEALVNRPGIVYSRQQLLDRIRGDDSVVAERLVDTYVRRLRRKFEEIDAHFDAIETVIGAGYRWRT
ncbi:MAG: response regulator transcription factor [Myxococcota bacterium]